MKLLDLFCKAGGAGMGYHLAGFEVVGVDIEPQPNYPFAFVQSDAISYLEEHGHRFDVIHASPPCQDHSRLKTVIKAHGTGWLLGAVRDAISDTGLPGIIENVPGAPMRADLMLCGSHFGLQAYWTELGKTVQLRRHRLFEYLGIEPPEPPKPCSHAFPAMPVYGRGVGGNRVGLKGPGQARICREVMGIDWVTRAELDQAIPPAYTRYIGSHLMEALCK